MTSWHWMLDAVFYLVDNGIKWRAMPADFPACGQVYAFSRRWRDGALVTELHHRLRGRLRERAGPNRRSRGSPRRSPSQR
ncbi:transposase [Streptomyces sp. NPDC002306]